MTTTRVAPQALAGATYHKSTHSSAAGNCVEVAAFTTSLRTADFA